MSALIDNLIFLHIPKAGGSTLRTIFIDQHTRVNQDAESIYVINRTRDAPAFSKLSPKKKEKISLLVGHFAYGIHKELPGNSRYVTMLRDPVDRVLSAYHYSKSFDRSDAFRVIQENNMDVVEFAEQYGGSWLINGQTKILAGAEPQTSLSDEELYLNALKNIENHFLYVGLLESFDRSLIHLQKVLNWSTPYYTIRNKTRKKSSVDIHSIRKIQDLVKYDIALYEHCNKHFNRQGGLKERYALSKFKILNKVYGLTR